MTRLTGTTLTLLTLLALTGCYASGGLRGVEIVNLSEELGPVTISGTSGDSAEGQAADGEQWRQPSLAPWAMARHDLEPGQWTIEVQADNGGAEPARARYNLTPAAERVLWVSRDGSGVRQGIVRMPRRNLDGCSLLVATAQGGGAVDVTVDGSSTLSGAWPGAVSEPVVVDEGASSVTVVVTATGSSTPLATFTVPVVRPCVFQPVFIAGNTATPSSLRAVVRDGGAEPRAIVITPRR